MTKMRKMTRREFMRMAAMMGGAGLLYACRPKITETPALLPTLTPAPTIKVQEIGSTTPTPQPTKAPDVNKRGGVLRISALGDVPTLDGIACSWLDWWIAYTCIYNRLINFDLNTQPYPDLAEDFPEISEDGLKYVFHLKKGVKFHNGRQMTAHDVKYTIDRQFARAQSSCYGGFLSVIKGTEVVLGITEEELPDFVDLEGTKAIDDFTFQVELKEPMAVFPYVFATAAGNVVPKEEYLQAFREGTVGTAVVIGTGPFKLKEWRPGELLILERNPEYYKPGLPYLDELQFFLNLDQQASILRFENRELDLMIDLPIEDAKRLLQDPVFKHDVRFSDVMLWSYVDFAFNTPPFNDVRMRQAVAMAIDRESLVAAEAGAHEPWYEPFMPGIYQYDPDFKPAFTYDPEKARAIVQELYPDGVKILFWPGGLGPEKAQIIQADLAAVGIDAELVIGEWGVRSDQFKTGEINMVVWGNAYEFPDGVGFLNNYRCNPEDLTRWPSAWPGKGVGVCDDKINQWLSEANRLPLLSEERTAILRQVRDYLVNEQVVLIGLRRMKMLDLYAQYIKDIQASPMLLLPMMEEAWIDRALFEKLKGIKPQAPAGG